MGYIYIYIYIYIYFPKSCNFQLIDSLSLFLNVTVSLRAEDPEIVLILNLILFSFFVCFQIHCCYFKLTYCHVYYDFILGIKE